MKNTARVDEPIYDSRNSDEPTGTALTDEAAFNYADNFSRWNDAVRKIREEDKRIRHRFYLRTIGSIIGAIYVIWLFLSCSHLTVAPKPVVATQIAFDENTQNAGVINCDQNGCLVTANWMAKYKAAETEFKQTISADANIKPEGKVYRVSYEVFNHFAEMRAAQRGP